MKAADIPEVEFLAAVEEARARRNASCATSSDVAWVLSGLDGAAQLSPAADYDAALRFPDKVVLAKAKSLIRRGLVDGCGCGCRGDFTLTADGRARLTAP